MNIRRISMGLMMLALLLFLTFCEERLITIIELRATDSSLAPGEGTMLYCEVETSTEGEITYVWEADIGSIESMGDSARWTAPDDMTWTNQTATITLTVEDEADNIHSETLNLEIAITRQDIQAEEDTYTFSYSPDTSYEDGEFLNVGFDESWGIQEAFFHTWISFPTPTIPSGETLYGARLRLYREYGEGEEMEIEIYLPRDDWQADGLTWNTEPDADDFAMISDNTTDVGSFYITLTSLVEDWIEGSRDNHGLMLRVSDETDYTHRFRNYGSMEGVDSKRPALDVVSW